MFIMFLSLPLKFLALYIPTYAMAWFGFLFMGCREVWWKLQRDLFWMSIQVYPVMGLSPFGRGGQALRLTGVINMQITAMRMDWREQSYSPSELPLSRPFWEIKMLFSGYCMMQVSSLDLTDPSTICCQDTSWWQEWDKKPALVAYFCQLGYTNITVCRL